MPGVTPHQSLHLGAWLGPAGTVICLGIANALFDASLPYDWTWVGCGDETNSLAHAISWAHTGTPSYGVDAAGNPYAIGLLTSPIYYLLYGYGLAWGGPEQAFETARTMSRTLILLALTCIGLMSLFEARDIETKNWRVRLVFWCGVAALLLALFTNTAIFTTAHFARLEALGVLGCVGFGIALGRAWGALQLRRVVWVLGALGVLLFMNVYALAACLIGAMLALAFHWREREAAQLMLLGGAATACSIGAFVLVSRIWFGATAGSAEALNIIERFAPLYGSVFSDPRRANWHLPLALLAFASLTLLVLRRHDTSLRLTFVTSWIAVVIFCVPVYRSAYDAMLIVLGTSFWFASTRSQPLQQRAAQLWLAASVIVALFHNVAVGGRLAPHENGPYGTGPFAADTFSQQPAANAALREQLRTLSEYLDDFPRGSVISIEPQHALLQATGANVMFFNPNARSALPSTDRYVDLLPERKIRYVLVNARFCTEGGPLCEMHAYVLRHANVTTAARQVGAFHITLERRIFLSQGQPAGDYGYCGAGVFPMSVFRVERSPQAAISP